MTHKTNTTICQGRHLRAVAHDTWESVERVNASGVVGIIAITNDNQLILTEQFRPPLGKTVIGLPAGLAGDITGQENEALLTAAQRELLEETGYAAQHWQHAFTGATSSGLTNETLTVFHATGLTRIHPGGGDEHENITVIEVPLNSLNAWLIQQRQDGKEVDLPVYAALSVPRPDGRDRPRRPCRRCGSACACRRRRGHL